MVAHGHDARPDAFRYPNLAYKIADFGFQLYQIVADHANPAGVFGMHPDGVAMADFIQPLGIGRAGKSKSKINPTNKTISIRKLRGGVFNITFNCFL